MWYYFECYGEQMGLFQVMRESVIGGLDRVRVTAKTSFVLDGWKKALSRYGNRFLLHHLK